MVFSQTIIIYLAAMPMRKHSLVLSKNKNGKKSEPRQSRAEEKIQQKHLIHLHQNNYEAKRWKSRDCACLCTNTPAAERQIKIRGESILA